MAPLLASLPRKLRKADSEEEELHYRVLFMERDMEEILQSQDAMLLRLGKASERADRKVVNIGKAYRQQERYAKSWCARLGIHAMSVSYHTLVHRPNEVLPEIAGFLGSVTDKLPAMRACIEPTLHRTRTNTRAYARVRQDRAQLAVK